MDVGKYQIYIYIPRQTNHCISILQRLVDTFGSRQTRSAKDGNVGGQGRFRSWHAGWRAKGMGGGCCHQ